MLLPLKLVKLFIYGRYLQKDGKDYPKDSKIQLIDNFPAFLFTSIEVKKHGKVLDEIENPGVCSTIKGLLDFSVDPNGPITRFEINGRRYPEETQDLDFKNEKYCEAYDSLMEYKKAFHKTHQELPMKYNDPNDFKTFREIYLVNMTRQPTNISATKQNIILHVDFNDEFLFDIEKGTIEESFTG
ncbi:hypothetical protein AGLY_016572 [Aphis glycines]|uniref:Uncharacterized protein n=1 Tax=Aphis glycines TaxID=307491 RepID=A0A6G0SZ28_APHGL|nr:hypothetical protein AGLY_016572 [Aphis glycines]